MTFSISSLVRLIVVLALGSTMLAVGVSKMDPPKPIRRSHVATRYSSLNEYFMNLVARSPRWLDVDTGKVVVVPLGDGEVLEAASCSSWVEGDGRYEAIGRWSSKTHQGPMSITTDFGLARYSFPDGRVLDHVSTEVVPVGPPCWYPGDRARVLFAAGDGQLYHFAFEPDPTLKAQDPKAKGDSQPIPLTWRSPMPGHGKVYLSDLTWPEDPRLRGYVIAAIREESHETEPPQCLTGTSLWWLKLDAAGTEIVDAAPILVPEADHRRGDRRTPTVGTLPDGRAVLAYLSEHLDGRSWDLRVVPIGFQGDHRLPLSLESDSVVIAGRCQPSPPSFSADGHWLNAIAQSANPGGQILRIRLEDHLGARK